MRDGRDLEDLAGVDEWTAAQLRTAGFGDIDDLWVAREAELSGVHGVSLALASRLKAEVGHRETLERVETDEEPTGAETTGGDDGPVSEAGGSREASGTDHADRSGWRCGNCGTAVGTYVWLCPECGIRREESERRKRGVEPPDLRKSPAIAAFFSLALIGGGQLYNHQALRAVTVVTLGVLCGLYAVRVDTLALVVPVPLLAAADAAYRRH